MWKDNTKGILKKHGAWVWNGFMWLRSGPTAGSQNKPSFFTKGRVYS
jgi:hypothetical protein